MEPRGRVGTVTVGPAIVGIVPEPHENLNASRCYVFSQVTTEPAVTDGRPVPRPETWTARSRALEVTYILLKSVIVHYYVGDRTPVVTRLATVEKEGVPDRTCDRKLGHSAAVSADYAVPTVATVGEVGLGGLESAPSAGRSKPDALIYRE